jgi:hypothetical protein
MLDPMGALGADLGPVALRRLERLFLYVIPALISTREIEDGCTRTPCSASSAAASSVSAMSGTASTISTRNST